VARYLGYRRDDLAEAWGVSPPRVTQVINNRERPFHWDHALWGLPPKRTAAKTVTRRLALVSTLTRSDPQDGEADSAAVNDAQRGEYTIEPGEVWVVRESPGNHLPEGCHGEVVRIAPGRDGFDVTFHFENGETDTYSLKYLLSLECFLSATGRQGGLKSK
jgi:hypothetical protein